MKDLSNFKQGYELIIENAKNHFNAAEAIAGQGSFGIANSHLILAAEEGIKAYIVFARHFDHDLIVEDFGKFFKDHKYKHEKIKELSFWTKFMKQVVMVMLKPSKNLIKEKSNNFSDKELMDARKEGIMDLVSWLKSESKIEDNEQWWSDANKNKNIGFYVSLNGSNWQTPQEITKDEYEKSNLIVSEILEWLLMLPETSIDPVAIKFYNEMKENYKIE